jgi:hypothetical protein
VEPLEDTGTFRLNLKGSSGNPPIGSVNSGITKLLHTGNTFVT